MTKEKFHHCSAYWERLRAQLEPRNFPICVFSADVWRWFNSRCEAWRIPVGPDKKGRLQQLYSHLIGVNSEFMNLTRFTDAGSFLKYHVLDSLIVYHVICDTVSQHSSCADVGSGAGYPGLPLMLWLPERKWCLIESRWKKACFLETALPLTLCEDAQVAAFRSNEVETIRPAFVNAFQFVVARAIGDTDKILRVTGDLLPVGGLLAALKGPRYPESEQGQTQKMARRRGFRLREEREYCLDVGDPARFLVVLEKEV